ncbi:hypothetical protein, partial [Salmonella enterica]|uniref:hypothetical protein n=1 Tax=Salmonella enterica TaxID=28901 RepID=UPI003CE8A7C0
DASVLQELESAPEGAPPAAPIEKPAPDATRAGLGISHRRARRGALFGRRGAEVPTAGADDVTSVIPAAGGTATAGYPAPDASS